MASGLNHKILLLGKDGQVGWELQRALSPLGEVVALGRSDADFLVPGRLADLVARHAPITIVNAAAYTAVDQAESDEATAQRVNAGAVAELAEAAAHSGAWLVHYSTDYVFDGEKSGGYLEDDPTKPLSAYGRSKLAGEKAIRETGVQHLIFRTSWVYGARGGNFARTMLRLAAEREQLRVIADQSGAPTSAELIADVTALALYRLGMDSNQATRRSGVYHLAAGGETSWHGYASFVIEQARALGADIKVRQIEAIPTEAYPLPALRPRNSRLDTTSVRETFGVTLPDWRWHAARVVRGWY